MGLFQRAAAKISIQKDQTYEVRFPVLLWLTVKTAEIDETAGMPGPMGEIRFEKQDLWPCPPSLGITVGGSFEPGRVEKVTIGAHDVICELTDVVTTLERWTRSSGLTEFKEQMLEDGWMITYECSPRRK